MVMELSLLPASLSAGEWRQSGGEAVEPDDDGGPEADDPPAPRLTARLPHGEVRHRWLGVSRDLARPCDFDGARDDGNRPTH